MHYVDEATSTALAERRSVIRTTEEDLREIDRIGRGRGEEFYGPAFDRKAFSYQA